MRILLISDEPHDAGMGGAKVALKLQSEMQSLGHVCDLLFHDDLGGRPRDSRLRLLFSPWLARHAARRSRDQPGNQGYDVVDAASAEGWLLDSRLRRHAAIVARSHGLEHRYYQELLADVRAGTRRKPWTRRLWYPSARLPQVAAALRRADRAILLSRADQDYVCARGWLPRERTEVIPHGVDADRWTRAPAPGAPRGAGVLFCSWWTVGKGAPDLVRAHARLLAQGVRVPLTLFGAAGEIPAAADASGTRNIDPALERRIRSHFGPEAQSLLRILPRTRDENAVFRAYAEHDLLVCPSTWEGFGLVVVEALSQRLPVICSTGAGAAELLHDGRDALLIPPRNPEALAAAIGRLWRSPRLRAELGENGRALAGSLSWRQLALRTLACYEKAIATHRARRLPDSPGAHSETERQALAAGH